MALKVVIIGSFWPASLESSYRRAFEHIGTEVTPIDFEAMLRKRYTGNLIARRLLWNIGAMPIARVVASVIRSVKPDLSFVIKGSYIPPSLLTEIKLYSGRLVNFNPDSPWEARNSSKRIIECLPIYDLHVTWGKPLISKFIEYRAKRVEYLPFAYDPELHKPTAVDAKIYDAVFVGTFEPHRDQTLSALRGRSVAIWGNGWERSTHVPKEWIKGSAIYGSDACVEMSKGHVNINILRDQNHDSHNMRTFEIPASANLMLTTRSREQSELFGDDAILSYSSLSELVDRVNWAVSHPVEAEAMRQRSFSVVREDTYVKRAMQILEYCRLA